MDINRRGQKTYWHFQESGRMPTDYELMSTQLLYYPERGFEVDHPVGAWMTLHQAGAPLIVERWDAFQDPRQTTYASYVSLQHAQEIFVDGFLDAMEADSYQRSLDPAWLEILEGILPVLRFVFHGLQMVACHVGHLAPSSRITIAAMFQAADELRRVQRMSYRMAQVRRIHPAFGDSSLHEWETSDRWLLLRESVERLMVKYDWSEAFVALNLGLKPVLEGCFFERFAQSATDHGDTLLGPILASLRQDGIWHQQWGSVLAKVAKDATPDNAARIQAWVDHWSEAGAEAVKPLVDMM